MLVTFFDPRPNGRGVFFVPSDLIGPCERSIRATTFVCHFLPRNVPTGDLASIS